MNAAWIRACTAIAAATLVGVATAQPAQLTACRADPLAGRALYLRGSFNAWASAQAQRFTWACNRFELVTRIQGEHRFKVGDEGWSADADLGRAPGAAPNAAAAAPLSLQSRGSDIERRFGGTHRFTLTMNESSAPQLHIEACPSADAGPPLGTTVLFLRGTPNNWAALDGYAFQFSCDAYYLNVKASGRHEFKIADAAWTEAHTAGPGGLGKEAGGNFVQQFDGEHTLRLAWAGGRPQLSVGPKTFADPRVAAVTDPIALSLRFDSRAAAHKTPFGAITPGSDVQWNVDALAGVTALTLVVEKRRLEGNQEVLDYSEVARVPMQRGTPSTDARTHTERWTARYRFNHVAIHGYWFEAKINDQTFALQNNTDAVFWTREKGSGGAASVGDLPPGGAGAIRRFRQTVYAADFKVPDWAADAVYYYIFPDRFRNGDTTNDPQPGRNKYQNHSVEFHKKWIGKPYRPHSGDGSDAVYNNDFFGGDLAGIIDKLDYIQELGANTIYMTPVFRAASNHKYDTADFKHIDPAFGSNADFTRLTQEAAQRGIRVIPDTSLNHVGSDSIYFDRYGNFKDGAGKSRGAFAGHRPRSDSPYASWFSFDTTQKDPDKQFKGWVGVTDLPELDKASPAWRNFAYRDPDSVMKLWLDRGAAGWRMDVAPWVPDDFWREWRTAIKAHRPDAITIAETWFDSSKYFLGDMFDSTMNYILRNTLLDYVAGGNAKLLYPNIELMREAYPPQAFHALMNLLSSHDQARSLHVLGWHDDTRADTAAGQATIALAKQRYKLAVFFQMTFPGAPAVYYGDEVGMTGGDDPYNRAPFPWADLGGEPDTEMLAWFKRLIKLRNEHPVLRRGTLAAPLHIDEQVIVLLRRLEGGTTGSSWAITATNNADTARSVEVQLPAELNVSTLRDAINGGSAVLAGPNKLRIDLPALGGRVWISPTR